MAETVSKTKQQNQLYNKFKLLLHCIVDNDNNEMKLYLCQRFIEEYLDNNSETDTETETSSEDDIFFESDDEIVHDFVKDLAKEKI